MWIKRSVGKQKEGWTGIWIVQVFLFTPPMKLEQTKCSETSAHKIRTPRSRPKERIQHSQHGESFISRILSTSWGGNCKPVPLHQRFSNFFQVGTTIISQNVLRTTLLLSALKENCLRFSTTVCDTQFTLILYFLSCLD
jgi:hypothetical protein